MDMLFDLHAHTTLSDGKKTPEEVIDHLSCNEYYTITDHNVIGAHEVSKTSCSFTGIEMHVRYGKEVIELLCYGYNAKEMLSDSLYGQLPTFESERLLFENEKFLLEKHGFILSSDVILESDGKAIKTLYADAAKYSANRNFGECMQNAGLFYRHLIKSNSSLYPIEYVNTIPDVFDVIDMCRRADGLVFLAHPYCYLFEKTMREGIIEAVTQRTDGVECFHSSASKIECQGLIEYAHNKVLHISGGSDYHGEWNGGRYTGTPHLELIKEMNFTRGLGWIEQLSKISK